MQNRHALLIPLLLLFVGLGTSSGAAAGQSIVGKWKGTAETPDGTIGLQIEFKQDGEKLAGTLSAMEETGPFSTVKFNHPSFSGDVVLGGNTYRLIGTMKDGKLEGTWEEVGGDAKGSWKAEPLAPPAPVATAHAGGVTGSWDSVAATPNGDLPGLLEIKMEGDKLAGEIRSDMGAVTLQAVSFKDDKLQFELELGGETYRVQATLKEDKLVGGWSPAAGGEGGAWNATRKATAVAAPASPAPAIVGAWNAVASTPDGEMQFVVDIKQTGEGLSGSIMTPDGAINLQKPVFANNTLTFEVEYMGGTYRIEAALAGDKLTGKWSAVSGSDSGNLTAERKK